MAESVYVNFPSQAVPDLEKISPEYGLKIGKAICQEWFKDSHNNRYNASHQKFHELRSVSYTHLTLPTKRIV